MTQCVSFKSKPLYCICLPLSPRKSENINHPCPEPAVAPHFREIPSSSDSPQSPPQLAFQPEFLQPPGPCLLVTFSRWHLSSPAFQSSRLALAAPPSQNRLPQISIHMAPFFFSLCSDATFSMKLTLGPPDFKLPPSSLSLQSSIPALLFSFLKKKKSYHLQTCSINCLLCSSFLICLSLLKRKSPQAGQDLHLVCSLT